MTDPNSAEFAARRLAARARLDAMDDAGASDPFRRAWFEAVYETAGDDPAQIPWADLSRVVSQLPIYARIPQVEL